MVRFTILDINSFTPNRSYFGDLILLICPYMRIRRSVPGPLLQFVVVVVVVFLFFVFVLTDQ